MQNEYEQDLDQIRSFCESRDLDRINEMLVQIEKKWAELDQHCYVNLLRAACDEIVSCEFTGKIRARRMLTKYATLALNRADSTQVDVQLHLLVSYLRLENRLFSLNVSDFQRERSASADLWLRIWNKVEVLIDEQWNPMDPKNEVKPYLPPADVPFEAGMSPGDIKDPKVRAEYEKHLKKSKEIWDKNKQQLMLRKLKAEYSEQVADYIVNLYSIPPFNNQELRKKLANLKDEDIKRKILMAIAVREKGGL